MRSSYRNSANEFLAAKKLKGEAELLLFYRTLILRLLVVLFLVSLSSMSFLLLIREVVVVLTTGVMALELILTFAGVSLFTGVALCFFLREEVFLSNFIKKAHRLAPPAPAGYDLSSSDSVSS